MRIVRRAAYVLCIIQLLSGAAHAEPLTLEAPRTVARFEPAEFVIRIERPAFANPFTEAELHGVFASDGGPSQSVTGFADSDDGSVFRLRFCPQEAEATYRYTLRFRSPGLDREFRGELHSGPPTRPGPVVAHPQRPRHFIHAGSKAPFYHLGYTAYHLLDPSNDDEQVRATIDYCAEQGFNKLRFLLAGYPRDLDRRTSDDVEFGVRDPWKAPNYGARPGQVNPLPVWPGHPHAYDFTRFRVDYWQRVDRAVQRMRERGIVATAILTIEKQGLPDEYGRLSEHEYRFYRYAVARLAAFDNIWWDLGNEHNEFRDTAWGDIMGRFVQETDPYRRLTSAHAYAEFLYPQSAWAGFIVTQQYGDPRQLHDWALKYAGIPKPYINEEYGYEGNEDKPGHGQNADLVRQGHWAIAMAGGYATYGDWSGGVSYFYMGEPGPGLAATQLKHLRACFESLSYQELEPHDELITAGLCLAKPPHEYLFYWPQGGEAQVTLADKAAALYEARWFDPRTGTWSAGPAMQPGSNRLTAPSEADWALSVRVKQ